MNQPPAGRTWPLHVWSVLVFLSGAAALIYEVIWSRQLATFLGITTYAHAAVLSAFMLGLALGSWALGAWSDRWRRPLALFGCLEIAIGLYGAFSSWLLDRLQGSYASWAGQIELQIFGQDSTALSAGDALRFAFAVGAVLAPAVLMGGTLPALINGLPSTGAKSGRALLGRLYGLNTLGAAAGALSCGYLLLGTFGVRGSTWLAASLNLSIGAAALLLSRLQPASSGAAPQRDSAPSKRRSLLWAFTFSGLLALSLQLLWTRALTLVIGSSVYAFSLVLGVYLLGTGLGSLLFHRLLQRRDPSHRPDLLLWIGRLEAALAFAIVLGLPVISLLPRWFIAAYRSGITDSFPLLQLLLFGLCAAVILVPTAINGALFPMFTLELVGAENPASQSSPSLGRHVGAAFAANSAGTFLGAPLAALILLPSLGIATSIVVAGAGHLALSLWLHWLRVSATDASQQPQPASTLLPGSAALGIALAIAFLLLSFLAPWNRKVMSSGPYINAFRLAEAPASENFTDWLEQRNQLLYYREGADATVSVRQDGAERLLVINGKTDGSRLGDRRTQVALGHLPMLMHPSPRRALVIGLGTGISAAATGLHADLEHLDIVEVSPEVVAASAFFDDDNRGILFDPRVRLIRGDARNVLLSQAEGPAYDVIVSEPSNPWISGISNMFTRELFALAESRLAPGGLFAQWFHGYGMSNQDLRTLLATFHSVLPQVTVWLADGGDFIFVGSRESHHLQIDRLERILQAPAAEADLGLARLEDLSAFAGMYLLGPAQVDTYVQGFSLNTDDRPRLELSAPRHLYSETTLPNLIDILSHRGSDALELPIKGLVRQTAAGRLQAFGIEMEPETAKASSATWQVRWQVFAAADRSQEPKVAITQDRSLDLEIQGRPIQIQITPTTNTEDRTWLTQLLPGTIQTSTYLTLQDGTPALLLRAQLTETHHRQALTFQCPGQPALANTALRYTIQQDIPAEDPAVASKLTNQLRCAN